MKKKSLIKNIAILVILIITVSVFSGCSNNNSNSNNKEQSKGSNSKLMEASNSFAGGSGTISDPYQISSVSELYYFAKLFDLNSTSKEDNQKYAKAYYVLIQDIELNSNDEISKASETDPTYKWESIGKKKDLNKLSFGGSFNGQNHYISGLYGNGSKQSQGLFSDLDGAEISNLTIKNSYFFAEKDTDFFGVIAGMARDSKIDNCKIENVKINNESASVGGIIAKCSRNVSLSNCETNGELLCKNSTLTAGLVGSIEDGCSLTNCINNINIQGKEKSAVAGVIASVTCLEQKAVKISNCVNNGNITSDDGKASGLIGRASTTRYDLIIENCKNFGNIVGADETAGILGFMQSSEEIGGDGKANIGTHKLINCENTGNITGKNDTGGILGVVNSERKGKCEISKCKNIGNVVGSNVGGVIGLTKIKKNASITITECENTGVVECIEYSIGGILGKIYSACNDCDGHSVEIKKCNNKGEIKSKGLKNIGGILGKYDASGNLNDKITIDGCSNSGNFTVDTPSWVGGIVSQLEAKKGEQITIENCKNSGNFNFNITSHENQDKEKTNDKDWKNYAAGIVVVANENIVLENNSNTGKLGEDAQKFDGIKFDESCCFKSK